MLYLIQVGSYQVTPYLKFRPLTNEVILKLEKKNMYGFHRGCKEKCESYNP